MKHSALISWIFNYILIILQHIHTALADVFSIPNRESTQKILTKKINQCKTTTVMISGIHQGIYWMLEDINENEKIDVFV